MFIRVEEMCEQRHDWLNSLEILVWKGKTAPRFPSFAGIDHFMRVEVQVKEDVITLIFTDR